MLSYKRKNKRYNLKSQATKKLKYYNQRKKMLAKVAKNSMAIIFHGVNGWMLIKFYRHVMNKTNSITIK